MLDEAVEVAVRSVENTPMELVVTLLDRGRRGDVDRLLDAMGPTRWRDLFTLLAAGDHASAADLCEELGVLPTAAFLRLRAAEGLASEGRADEARSQLKRAREFWGSVGATHYMQEADRIAAIRGRVPGKVSSPASRTGEGR